MKKKLLFLTFVFSLAILMPMKQKFISKKTLIYQRLGLDKNQIEQIESINREYQTKIARIIIKIKKKQLDKEDEMLNDQPDLTKLKTIISDQANLNGTKEYLTLERDLKIKKLLTKEQWVKFLMLKKAKRHKKAVKPKRRAKRPKAPKPPRR